MVRNTQLRSARQGKSAVCTIQTRESGSQFLALARIDHSHSVE